MKLFAFEDLVETGEPISVLARVSVVGTAEGGRTGPFTQGYRPNHNFGGPEHRSFYVGQVEVPAGVWVHPGETRDLAIKFLYGKGLRDLLQLGRTWRIQEGQKLVATAQVLALLPTT